MRIYEHHLEFWLIRMHVTYLNYYVQNSAVSCGVRYDFDCQLYANQLHVDVCMCHVVGSEIDQGLVGLRSVETRIYRCTIQRWFEMLI